MEPAAMAKPVIFGPTIQNAYEASLLVDRGGAKLVQTPQQLADAIIAWLNDDTARTTAGNIGKQFNFNRGESRRGRADFGAFTEVCVNRKKNKII